MIWGFCVIDLSGIGAMTIANYLLYDDFIYIGDNMEIAVCTK